MAKSQPNIGQSANSTQPFTTDLLQFSFMKPADKLSKETGRRIMSAIYKQESSQTSTYYFGNRQIRWRENFQWAMGRQSMDSFKDFVSIDGNKAYVNIDFTPIRTGPQFLETIVNYLSINEEYAQVSAVDDLSQNKKKERKEDALFRMYESDAINGAQQAAGIHLEPPTSYVPDDKLAAEVYFELEDRLPIEIRFEKELEKIKHDNEVRVKKRSIYRDLAVYNCAVTKVEKAHDGFVYIRKCVTQNMVYSFMLSDSGKMELSYIGEIYSLKVRDLRKKYGRSKDNPNGLDEKEIFEMAKGATQYNVANRFFYYWQEDYRYVLDRPYDDYSIMVFDAEVKTVDCDYATGKPDAYGRENIHPKNYIPNPTSDKATVYSKDKTVVYRGIWAVKADKMIYWGLPDVVIKPYMDISEALFSYTINIPNNDGDYIPSLFERAIEPLRLYTLCTLKIKQLIAAMVPPGYAFDVEGMKNVNIGGGKTMTYDEIVRFFLQTGHFPWSSRGMNPADRETIPIRGYANAEVLPQLNDLMAVREKSKAEIRELTGVSIYIDGSFVAPRTGAAVVENQTENTNNVMGFLTEAYLELWQETLYKCCILKWDEAVLKNNENELMDTILNVNVQLKITSYEQQMLEKQIAIAMQEGLLSFKDAFYLRQIKNYKLANLYLSAVTEKNKREAAQAQQANVQMTAQAQQASNAQTAQNALQLEQMKAQIQEQKDNNESNNTKQEILLQGIFDMLKSGMPIPDFMMPIVQNVLGTVGLSSAMDAAQIKQEMAAAFARQMTQQQAAQQPQGPQQQAPMPQQNAA